MSATETIKKNLQEIFNHTQGECEHDDIESCNAEIKKLAEESLALLANGKD